MLSLFIGIRIPAKIKPVKKEVAMLLSEAVAKKESDLAASIRIAYSNFLSRIQRSRGSQLCPGFHRGNESGSVKHLNSV